MVKGIIKRGVGGSTRNPTEAVPIGSNYYYLGDLMDKHLHALKNATAITRPRTSTEKPKNFYIKKGAWLGVLDSYAIRNVNNKDVLVLLFKSNHLSPQNDYFIVFESDLIDEKILKYNYKTLPTQKQSDTKADKKDAEYNPDNSSVTNDGTGMTFSEKLIIGGVLLVGIFLLSGNSEKTTVLVPRMSGNRKRNKKTKKNVRR